MIQDAEPTDDRLLRRWVHSSDRDALAALFHRYSALVLGVCLRQCRCRADAEDACQVTFMILARSSHTIRNGRVLPAWLHTTAYRVATRTRQQTAIGPITELPLDALADDKIDPLDRVSRLHELRVLDEELQQLPEHLRVALILRYLEGDPIPEMAERLNTTSGAIRGRLGRGRRELRRRMILRGVSLGVVMLATRRAAACNSAAGKLADTATATLNHRPELFANQPVTDLASSSGGSSPESLLLIQTPGAVMKSVYLATACSLALTVWISNDVPWGPSNRPAVALATADGQSSLSEALPLTLIEPDQQGHILSQASEPSPTTTDSAPESQAKPRNDEQVASEESADEPNQSTASDEDVAQSGAPGGFSENGSPGAGGNASGGGSGGGYDAGGAAGRLQGAPGFSGYGTVGAAGRPQGGMGMISGGGGGMGGFAGAMGGQGMGGMGGGMGGMGGGMGGFPTAPPQPPQPSPYEQQLMATLDQPLATPIEGDSVDQIAAQLQAQLQIPVVMRKQPTFEGVDWNQPVQLQASSAPLSVALKNGLRPLNLRAIVRDDAVMILPDTEALARQGIGTDQYISVDDAFVREAEQALQQRVDAQFENTPLSEVLRSITESLAGTPRARPQTAARRNDPFGAGGGNPFGSSSEGQSRSNDPFDTPRIASAESEDKVEADRVRQPKPARPALKLRINDRALEDLGLTADVPISIDLGTTTAMNALETMLSDLDLAMRPRNGFVEITTIDEAESPRNGISRVYWLDATGFGSADTAMLLIQTAVSPDVWEALGGPSTMAPVQNSSSGRIGLVVVTTYATHREIDRLLSAIRQGLVDPSGLPTP